MKGDQVWKVGDGDVDDIRIYVFDKTTDEDDTMDKTTEKERRYETQFGWKDEWKEYEFYKNPDDEPKDDIKKESWKKYKEFVNKWERLVAQRKVPIWYKFNPTDPDGDFGLKSRGHNSLKSVDEWKGMYDFLKKQKWIERDAELTEHHKNKYTETSEFVVDCSRLLGVGGEAVVIRKDVRDIVRYDEDQSEPDSEFEALKIIPIIKHNFESEKLDEMKNRVEARHDKADPECNKDLMKREEKRRKMQKQNENQNRKG